MLRSDIRRAQMRTSISDRQPDLEHRQKVRELLAALAEIDHAYQVDLETVRTSDVPIMIEQIVLNNMRQRHQVRRAPYLHELETLQNQWRGDRRRSSRGCHWPSGTGAGNISLE